MKFWPYSATSFSNGLAWVHGAKIALDIHDCRHQFWVLFILAHLQGPCPLSLARFVEDLQHRAQFRTEDLLEAPHEELRLFEDRCRLLPITVTDARDLSRRFRHQSPDLLITYRCVRGLQKLVPIADHLLSKGNEVCPNLRLDCTFCHTCCPCRTYSITSKFD